MACWEGAQGATVERDLVYQLRNRLNLVWRYGELVAEAIGEPAVQSIWRDIQQQELARIGRLKRRIADYMDQGVFLPGL